MSVGAYGFLMVSTGVCGQMLVSEGAKWCQNWCLRVYSGF